MTKNQQKIYTALAKATERALKEGAELIPSFGDGVTCGCPISFFVMQGTKDRDVFPAMQAAFSVSRDDVWGIIGGFDLSVLALESPEMAIIGQSLRETYYETT